MPIAGRGSRFAECGFKVPKPLIPVHGVPMIEVVVNNIRPSQPHRFIFVALREHLDHLGIHEILQKIAPGCSVVPVERVTEGPACTVLLAREWIDSDDPLMIANSDQWVDINIDDYLTEMNRRLADGLIMTMWANDPKWSYVAFGPDDTVINVVEKKVISNDATVGIYNFRHGRTFVDAADDMIASNMRVNGEFYVAPVYNGIIAMGRKVVARNVGRERQGMWGLGIPRDLEMFLKDPISQRIALTRSKISHPSASRA